MSVGPGTGTVPLKMGTMPKGGMSRSSPSLNAAFSLRNYSLDRKRIPIERSPSQPHLEDASFTKVDLVGGNGAWRQKKAVVVFEKRRIQELEELEKAALREKELRRRRMLQEERRRKQAEDERRELMAHREAQIRERLEKEEQKRREAEQERQRRKREEREWLAKQPKTCEACSGSGKCMACDGSGTIFSMFLVSKVTDDTDIDFGRVPQGCEECGGYRHNVMGKLRDGTGICAACRGEGKIWPKPAQIKTGRPRFNHSPLSRLDDCASPTTPGSPMFTFGNSDRKRTFAGASPTAGARRNSAMSNGDPPH